MALNIGARLGHYDVTALVGEAWIRQVHGTTGTILGRDAELGGC